MQLSICATPSNDLVPFNLVYVAQGTSAPKYAKINDHVFSVSPHRDVQAGQIALNSVQRKSCRVSIGELVQVQPFQPPPSKFDLVSLSVEIDYTTKRTQTTQVDAERLLKLVKQRYKDQVFVVGQMWVVDFEGTSFILTCTNLAVLDEESVQIAQSGGGTTTLREKPFQGRLTESTALPVRPAQNTAIKLVNVPVEESAEVQLFKPDFNFEELGIGGLNNEFGAIFRRAFASRIFPPALVAKLGINHVKGILLYGPPGTGKTLMARQIGKMLKCHPPKIVNGPEVLNKYVGQTEENVRNLFADAERDAARGEDSTLHLIIFDEIDAICKQRGSVRDGTGVHDGVVNQLLSKIDGVESLNNVLIIGMTNRKDLIDEALMRPGRFEVQIEIGLPDEAGRVQIFTIHTSKLRAANVLGGDVQLEELAALSKNYSGAEIEGVVKCATSFAFNRQVDVSNPSKPINSNDLKVSRRDFMNALDEVKPAFGVQQDELDVYIRHGLFDYGQRWATLQATCSSFVAQLRRSKRTDSLAVLLEGPVGSGKTALAAHLALQSGFPYVKVVTGESLVGYSEIAKCNILRKVFDDAYKSPFSVIVLDDLERLIGYVHVGQQFSNSILQTLLVLIKKAPPKSHKAGVSAEEERTHYEQTKKLLVVGTTSSLDILQSLELTNVFTAELHVPSLAKPLGEVQQVLQQLNVKFVSPAEERQAMQALPPSIALKALMTVTEMASAICGEGMPTDEGVPLTADAFVQALRTCGCEAGDGKDS
eukprot:TRINITY_DN653_c0_g1_i1.p1 TRINITY_DN653_c0_g1~~TRINITY_DN653_c0_g1_i1.p1  ORF type:complete len:779 (+),score=221.41 TRINITY_DN653_c0_g1_i1:49-2337(+)